MINSLIKDTDLVLSNDKISEYGLDLPQKCYMLRLLLEKSNNHKSLFVCLFLTRSRINEWHSGSTFSDKRISGK